MPDLNTFEAVVSETMDRCAQLRDAVLLEREYAAGKNPAPAKRTNELQKLTAEVIALVRKAAALVRKGDTAAEHRLQEVRNAVTEVLDITRESIDSLRVSREEVLRELQMQDRRTSAIRAYTAIAR